MNKLINNLKVKFNGYHPSDIEIKCGDNLSMGHVQTLKIDASVGDMTTIEVRSLMSEVEVEAIQEMTNFKVEIQDNNAYDKGKESLNTLEKNPYKHRSYGWFMFNCGLEDALLSQEKENHKNKKIDQHLEEINKTLNISSENLKNFGNELSKIAKETGQSFETASKAAAEFSREGLNPCEVLKRTKDALILLRLCDGDLKEIIKVLNCLVSTFNLVEKNDAINKTLNQIKGYESKH